jgi:hypothetical protein
VRPVRPKSAAVPAACTCRLHPVIRGTALQAILPVTTLFPARRADRFLKLGRRYLFRSCSNPRIRRRALAALLKSINEFSQPFAKEATRSDTPARATKLPEKTTKAALGT